MAGGFKDSSSSVFKLDDVGGTLRTLSAFVDSVNGLPGEIPLNPVTMLADAGEKSIRTIPSQTFDIAGAYDSTATTGPDVILGGLLTGQTATASFEYHPEGTSTPNPKYTGECWIKTYVITSKAKSRVEYTASFQVDGVVARG